MNEERSGKCLRQWNIFVVILTHIFHNGQPSHGCDRTIFEVMSSTELRGTLCPVASLLAATLYQGNPDRNYKLSNIVSTGRYILHMQVLLECCYIWMESSRLENWNYLFCRKVSFLTAPSCLFWGVDQGMKQTLDIVLIIITSFRNCKFHY